jgi:hypothetical protein
MARRFASVGIRVLVLDALKKTELLQADDDQRRPFRADVKGSFMRSLDRCLAHFSWAEQMRACTGTQISGFF